ncbi:hypothetical protein Q5P01_011795 [Channa striata]|uniref:Uncharacterized protein n=1 Tax=Channa striata TaxID=64152 RepID=A0AA88MU24_CHASR|nr:hypothetical protein Q5P01_011795 [Channa striata]
MDAAVIVPSPDTQQHSDRMDKLPAARAQHQDDTKAAVLRPRLPQQKQKMTNRRHNGANSRRRGSVD